MRPFRLMPAVFTLLGSVTAAGASDGEALFVTCDNGLRCIKAPCPARDVVALPSGKRYTRTGPKLRLSAADGERLAAGDGLYSGTIVLGGAIEEGPPVVIVATRVVRPATAQEAALCRRR